MRAPLSWLRDFAPFPDDPAHLAATLDDLGLVVEGVETVGEGLDDVVVARVDEVRPIPGADRIRAVVVEAGDGPLEIVCGADNYGVGDLVPLAPVGATLPGGFTIARRTLRGVTSNGMLCSGAELGLSTDGAGLLVLSGLTGAVPGEPLTAALGLERDTVFDLAVEGNRPDAWCMAGVARDLAARLGLPFTLPDPPDVAGTGTPPATAVVESPDLCPRLTVRVLEPVAVGESPQWLARRLTLAGMRPINSVVDASNYVMLELGQPTHPYDLDRLGAPGLLVRRARPGETVVTLDGVTRTLGEPGRGLGDTGEDCVICDADGTAVGIGGVMGGGSSEIGPATTRVLLEAAYFTPMAIARTAKRLGLRTEASARFERGCDPWGIDRAAARFCQLVGAPQVGSTLDRRGEVPAPHTVTLSLGAVRGALGLDLDAGAVDRLLAPIGFAVTEAGDHVEVTVPTNRPDVRPGPFGAADVLEEVARTYGYARLPRRTPLWPEPGTMTPRQRERRRVRDVCCGLGAHEAWTPTFVVAADHEAVGLTGPAVEVANPIVADERYLRRTMLPGLLRALAHNAARGQRGLRLFEVGTVFSHPDEDGGRRAGRGGGETVAAPGERELLSVALAAAGDDAAAAVAAWHTLADALGLAGVRLVAGTAPGLHPTRTARLVAAGGRTVGQVGEVDPEVVAAFSAAEGRVGWLAVDLGLLGDPAVVARRPQAATPVSRYPTADIDLALVLDDDVPADELGAVLAEAGGELLVELTLFDVYRGPGVAPGRRSLAWRLRFGALDRTLTDAEVGELRSRCVAAAAERLGAELR